MTMITLSFKVNWITCLNQLIMSKRQKFNPIIEAEDDSLEIPDVGQWAIEKYTYFGYYCDIFTTSMEDHWENLIYIDLFSGSGFSKIKNNRKVIYGSPLIALSIPHPFTRYILCERDIKTYEILMQRVNRLFPIKNIKILNRDSNEAIDEIISYIPRYSKQNRVLTFTFVDPYSLNLNFKTIKKLRPLKMDFLILLAFHMDANRNFQTYYEMENHKTESFLDKNN